MYLWWSLCTVISKPVTEKITTVSVVCTDDLFVSVVGTDDLFVSVV